jgi:hypothetical protein
MGIMKFLQEQVQSIKNELNINDPKNPVNNPSLIKAVIEDGQFMTRQSSEFHGVVTPTLQNTFKKK